MKKILALLIATTASSAFAATPVIKPGTYTNSTGCTAWVEVEEGTSRNKIDLVDHQGKGGRETVIVDLAREVWPFFTPCHDTEMGNYPIDFEVSSSEGTDSYSLKCGGAFKMFSHKMRLDVDSQSGELVGFTFLRKVAALSLPPGAYIPGVNATQVKMNCENLKLSK